MINLRHQSSVMAFYIPNGARSDVKNESLIELIKGLHDHLERMIESVEETALNSAMQTSCILR